MQGEFSISHPHTVTPSSYQLPAQVDTPTVQIWLTDSTSIARIPFIVAGLFYLLADDGFYDRIIEKYNYPVEILAQSMEDQSRITSWREITKEDMKIFFWLFLAYGNQSIKWN